MHSAAIEIRQLYHPNIAGALGEAEDDLVPGDGGTTKFRILERHHGLACAVQVQDVEHFADWPLGGAIEAAGGEAAKAVAVGNPVQHVAIGGPGGFLVESRAV